MEILGRLVDVDVFSVASEEYEEIDSIPSLQRQVKARRFVQHLVRKVGGRTAFPLFVNALREANQDCQDLVDRLLSAYHGKALHDGLKLRSQNKAQWAHPLNALPSENHHQTLLPNAMRMCTKKK